MRALKVTTVQNFNCAFRIFIDADIADQASIFSTVNLAQTKVNKSLVYDLYDYQKSRSPQKSAHNVAIACDRRVDGPFYQRIKRLGFASRPGQTLTQAAVVEELLRLMSREPNKDRDALMRGKKLSAVSYDELMKTPFRKMFVTAKDGDIAINVNNFFSAVRQRWPTAWGGNRGAILPKTNGFKSLMWALGELYARKTKDGTEVFESSEYGRYLRKVNLEDADFNTDMFKPGSGGQASLKDYLREAL